MAKSNSQKKFAKKVYMTQPEVSQLLSKGVLTRGASIDQWHREYIMHMRKVAARWSSTDGRIDRMEEAALLDRIKREEIQSRLDERNGQLLPTSMFIEGVSQAFTTVKYLLLAVPNKFKMRCPHISDGDIKILSSMHRDVCAELSGDAFPARIRKEVEAKLDRQPEPGRAPMKSSRRNGRGETRGHDSSTSISNPS